MILETHAVIYKSLTVLLADWSFGKKNGSAMSYRILSNVCQS